jgi:hypothetical protein
MTGPLAGGVFVLDDRLEIGRDVSCDIQILSEQVSRRHAVVTRDGDTVSVQDGKSTNGTWVDGERVDRRDVRAGDTIRVADCELLVDSYPMGDTTAGPSMDRIVEPSEAIPLPDAPLPAYDGNLVADIVLYRNLRLLKARGKPLHGDMEDRFPELERGLQSRGKSGRGPRSFRRFDCALSAKVAGEDSRTQSFSTELESIAVDGATITQPSRSLAVDSLCYLSVPMMAADGLRTVIFTARVVWVGDGDVELVFSGAPTWTKKATAADDAATVVMQRKTTELRAMNDD